jgi:hypothetical protein
MKNFLRDMLEQSWTLLGLGTAWLVLEGSAKEVTGNLILITLGIWAATYRLRNPKEK